MNDKICELLYRMSRAAPSEFGALFLFSKIRPTVINRFHVTLEVGLRRVFFYEVSL